MPSQIMPNSPAEKSGLLPGDAIVSVRNENGELRDDMLTAENISNLTSMSGQAVSIVYIRGSESAKNTFVVPEEGIVNGRKAVGIAVAEVGILKLPFLKSFVEGGISIGRMIADIWRGITQLFSGSGWSQITGPVGLAKVAGKTGQLGFSYFISLIAFVSVNLAVINLLPFPALDGGRLAVLTLEAIIRRPLKPAAVRWINSAGFAILLILMVVITIHDILRI
jgi:regulator of sigma E protease